MFVTASRYCITTVHLKFPSQMVNLQLEPVLQLADKDRLI